MENMTFPPFWDTSIIKLRFVLSEIGITRFKIPDYEEECLYVLYDNLVIFMKSFVRAMADRKKKFKVDCPVLTGIKDESEDPSKVQKEGQGIENLMPWESKVIWKNLTREEIEMVKVNDEKETELNNKRKKPGQYSNDSKQGKFMDTDQEANGENDGTDNKGNKDEEKKKEEEKKDDKKEDVIPTHVTEFISPEIVYETHRYVVRDMIDLLKVNPHVIPKKSFRQVLMMRALKKIKTKPTNVIV